MAACIRCDRRRHPGSLGIERRLVKVQRSHRQEHRCLPPGSLHSEGCMEEENRCPICGSKLSRPGEDCPFCAEARKLVLQLAAEEPVRLCRRCGALLDEQDEGELCAKCILEGKRPPPLWRRDDRVASWIYRMVDQPSAAEVAFLCPHCNRYVDRSAVFCPHCGKRVSEPPGQAQEEAVDPGDIVGEGAHPAEDAPAEDVRAEDGPIEPVPAPESTMVEAAPSEAMEGGVSVGPASTGAFAEQTLWDEIVALGRGILDGLRGLFRPKQPRSVSQGWIWLVVVLFVALLAVAYLWMQILSSGGITFR